MTQQQIEKDKFKIVGGNHEATEKLADKSVSFWKEVFIRFSHNKMAIFGLIALIIIFNGYISADVFTIPL